MAVDDSNNVWLKNLPYVKRRIERHHDAQSAAHDQQVYNYQHGGDQAMMSMTGGHALGEENVYDDEEKSMGVRSPTKDASTRAGMSSPSQSPSA